MVNNYIVLDIETSGLNSCFGNYVTCICAKDSLGERFKQVASHSNAGEKILIINFMNWLFQKERESFAIVSANGVDFDIPFLVMRAFISGLGPEMYYHLTNRQQFDLQTITAKKVSLNDLATLFLGKKKTGNGSQAIQLYLTGRHEELANYCMDDVDLTEEVFLAYEQMKKNRELMDALKQEVKSE